MSRTLLVDGDIVVYQTSARVQRPPVDWGDGIVSPEWADTKEAKGQADAYLGDLMDTLKGDRLVIALKDKENWRKRILPSYKAHREGVEVPMLRVLLHEYFTEAYEVFQRPTLEGDDVLGILATNPHVIKGEKIVVSVDKDLKTVPGLHYNPMKPDLGITEIGPVTADRNHMMQTLTGDPTDGYSGCPGVGPKRAEKILGSSSTGQAWWENILSAYAKAGLGPEVALTMARVARICRWTDYDYKRKEVILWTPPVI